MKYILIVGTGKAAYLHYLKYLKLGINNICFLSNTYAINENIKSKIYYTIEDIFKNTNFNVNETIVDICTPCSEFKKIIDDFISYNVSNFIVEKPFIVDNDYFDDKLKINFAMIENYKYSSITKYIYDYIHNNNLKIQKMIITFSKDRINESFSKRGIADEDNIPTNFEIEMPHALYLANYFINSGKKEYSKILLKDMKKGNQRLPKHGYGYIQYNQNNTEVVLESNLMLGPNKRNITILCDNNISISADYINYNKDFVRQSRGIVEINRNGNKKRVVFEDDDNMYYTLKDYLSKINDVNKAKQFKNEIINFSNDLKYCIDVGKDEIKNGK